MAKSGYVPNAGDVVWFSPQAGHEQAGHRQAVVLTQAGYNRASGMMICMPMNTQIKGYPFEVPIASTKPSAARCWPIRLKASTG
jgi:mRNA interferase MazF